MIYISCMALIALAGVYAVTYNTMVKNIKKNLDKYELKLLEMEEEWLTDRKRRAIETRKLLELEQKLAQNSEPRKPSQKLN